MKKLIAIATLATFLGAGSAWAMKIGGPAKGPALQKVDKSKADAKVTKAPGKPGLKGKVLKRKGRDILRDLIKKGKIKPMSKKDRDLRKQRKLQAEKDLDKFLK